MERKLASIQRVREIRPIEGADSIEIALVNSWQVIVKKGEYNPGDLCIYCEIDSFLPIKPEFEFLRKSSYKKMGDQEGFRLKTVKLRGELSQGLLLPISVLEDGGENKIGISEQPWGSQLQLGPYDNALVIEEGTDITEIMGIVKYEAPIPASLAGIAKGAFPGFLRKTDEERCLSGETEIITEDGVKTISKICETKYKGKVLSHNIEEGIDEWGRINSHSIQCEKDDWYEVETECGVKIIATSNHKFWIDNLKCYRELIDLSVGDTLKILKKTD